MRLLEVRSHYVPFIEFLYELLSERDPAANISHREMPTFEKHWDFIRSQPYEAWYIIYPDDDPVGAVYLTRANEIGIAIKKEHQGNGYAKKAIWLLMAKHPATRFLANIAPGNERSRAMFEKLGFKLKQHTFILE